MRINKKIVYITILLISGALVAGMLTLKNSGRITDFLCNSEKSQETEFSEKKVEKWFFVAETNDFKIFYGGAVSGNIVSVLDKNSNDLLVPDESCEMEIPAEKKSEPETFFKNVTVGINILDPYKSIYTKNYDENIFVQSVLFSGCAFEEGEITVFRNNLNGRASCTVKVQYKDLGC